MVSSVDTISSLGDLAALNRAILASIGRAVIVSDLESRIRFMNPAAEKLTGWEQNDALQKPLTDVFRTVNEETFQPAESPVESVTRDVAVADLADHTVLIARDGGEWPIDGNASPILDEAGLLAGVVLAFHDIGSRVKAEQELEISEIRYRRLFEAAHDGIMILDAVTAKVLDVNPFMARLLGYPREHFLRKELWEIGVFQDAEMSKKAMTTLQRLGRIRYEDLPLQHKNGSHIPVEFVSNVYREGRHNVIQCNIRDRQPVQERISGEHESRDPHADGRHPGIRRHAAAQEPGRMRAGRLRSDHTAELLAPAGTHQRNP